MVKARIFRVAVAVAAFAALMEAVGAPPKWAFGAWL